MPPLEHELPLDLIRHFPALAPCLLEHVSATPLPEFTRARCDSGDATTTAPPELRADSVVVLERPPDSGAGAPVPVLVIVVECQRRPDERKRFSWPAYVANLRARLECPTVLLVLSPNRAVAQWCAAPIDLGWGSLVHRPVVLSLTDLAPVTDPGQACAEPELAILAAIVHHASDPAVLDALLPAIDSLAPAKGTLYADYVLAVLPAAARKYLEDAVTTGTYEFKSDLFGRVFAEGKAEGRAEGEANSVLLILETRGITVPDHVRHRITSCTDLDQLATWVRRALTVTTAEELFC